MIVDLHVRLFVNLDYRVGRPAFGVLEPGAVKVARRVLRRVRGR